jgi:hypothetical protein
MFISLGNLTNHERLNRRKHRNLLTFLLAGSTAQFTNISLYKLNMLCMYTVHFTYGI